MKYFIIFISFILDYFFNRNINQNSLFFPLFTLLSLVITCSYKTSFLIGFIYDIIFTNTLFFNSFIFLVIMYIVKKLYMSFSYNYLTRIIIGIFAIILYRIICYLLFTLFMIVPFDILSLLKGIYSSLIVNFVYLLIFSFFIKTDK